MKIARVLLYLVVVLVALVATTSHAWAFPSEGFHEIEKDIFDDWEICRTKAFGEDGFYQITQDGFRPVIVFQSLGENTDLAYTLGEQIASEYSNPQRRAEEVFNFVRDRVTYTPDVERTGNDEFAENADELAMDIAEDGIGYGDCEDMTVLLAVMYRGAGFRCAIALVTGHTALLVHLPTYEEATAFFELDGESGWVWAEATGRNNPLGWAPKQYLNEKIPAYEVSAEEPPYEIPADTVAPLTPPPAPAVAASATGEGVSYRPFSFFGVIGLLWFISLFRRRRRH